MKMGLFPQPVSSLGNGGENTGKTGKVTPHGVLREGFGGKSGEGNTGILWTILATCL